MEQANYQFEDFLMSVNEAHKDFVLTVHETLLREGCKVKIESKASGFFVSYAHPKTKRSLLNFIFRKKGLIVRLYPSDVEKCAQLLDRLPESMEKEIAKACNCKRLIDPADCNSKCPMGYDITIRGTRYQKCRYNCFMFTVTDESVPFIMEFIALEREA